MNNINAIIMCVVLFGCILAAFWWTRKPGLRDWLLVFFLTGVLANVQAMFYVHYGLFTHPYRWWPDVFATNVMFDLFYFPTFIVLYNVTSRHSGPKGIVGQAVLYAAAMTFVEWLLVRFTDLISYDKWTIGTTAITFLTFLLLIRSFMSWLRRVD